MQLLNEVDDAQPITSLKSRGEGEAIRLRPEQGEPMPTGECDPFMSHTHSLPCATLVAWRTEWMTQSGCPPV